MAADESDNREEIRVFVEKENPNLDLERCSAASCSSSSSATAVNDLKRKAADRMVEIELDAARALADFAQLALLQSGNSVSESSKNWGNKGRRSTKRVKNESLEWGKNFEGCKLKPSDLVQVV
ncbi:Basic-leucine zipper domain [Thalictrum thalictroides]|uniref:Basic-leucine zipper domain n=1 Tax=Thalictrum thalictroides TaxID=46969 RepID=A0A7J6V3M6_THATH|nr:Basic-leucine zipper domain [Thalictrum thalictroides]